jgi:hypothetical protein
MNARERITQAVGGVLRNGYSAQERRFGLPANEVANVVLALLPELLTDEQVVTSVAWDLDPVDGVPERQPIRAALAAAAKALTEDRP